MNWAEFKGFMKLEGSMNSQEFYKSKSLMYINSIRWVQMNSMSSKEFYELNTILWIKYNAMISKNLINYWIQKNH